MIRTCFIVTLLVLFVGPQVSGVENIYTWKDTEGVINITDKAPPDGVEILDISPAPPRPVVQSKKQPQPATQKANPQSQQQQKKLLNQATGLRAEEAAAWQKAEELIAEAEELRNKTGARAKRKNRYRRHATVLEQEAGEFIKKAEAAAKKAEKIEKGLNTP